MSDRLEEIKAKRAEVGRVDLLSEWEADLIGDIDWLIEELEGARLREEVAQGEAIEAQNLSLGFGEDGQ